MKTLFVMALSAGITNLIGNPIQGADANATHPLPDSKRTPLELADAYYEDRLKLFPLDATVAGDNRYNDLLPNNLMPAFRAELESFYKRYQSAANDYDLQKLSAEDRDTINILKWECDIHLEDLKFPTHLLPIDQFRGLNLQIAQWAGGTSAQPFKTVQDYENWLKRLDAFVAWCASAQTNMREGITKGWVLPKTLTSKVIPQMAALSKSPVEDHVFYSPIKLMPAAFSPVERTRITEAYTRMIRDRIIPAFRSLEEFLTKEYLPASRRSSGISDVPRGRDYYNLQIKIHTTTELTADEVFDIGQREVQRLMGEMEKVKQTVGFKGTLKAFFEHVRTKPALMPFTDPQHVIDNFKAIHDRIKPALSRSFNLVPKTAFEIRRTEAFREASASAEYNPGSLDGTRPGIFYVPIPDVRTYNYFSDEDLFLHEAIPGHHYQISIQQENSALPKLRRTLWYGAYGEGWALYCESLGKELGLYSDPYQYFGMLSAEMHRAIRLVVDVGLHAKGWTREQAIQYSLEHEAESEASIIAEIERYMAWPGQALSYKIGQLKIRELRAGAEQQLGNHFDLRAFHDQILAPGCLPLKLLEERIEKWIGG